MGFIRTHTAADYTVDIIAGLIIAVVLVPETIAYASIAGLPPEVQVNEDELIIKGEGPVYFANMNYVEEQLINLLAEHHHLKRFILDARAITDLDLSAESLLWILLKILVLKNCQFGVVGVGKHAHDLMKASGFYDFLGEENFFGSIPDAVQALRRRAEAGKH